MSQYTPIFKILTINNNNKTRTKPLLEASFQSYSFQIKQGHSCSNYSINMINTIFKKDLRQTDTHAAQCDEMIDNRAAFKASFVDLWVLSRFLIISEFHVLIFVQLVTDLVKYLRLAVGKCVSNKIWNKLYSILLWKWQQWMDKTFRQPLQTEQGLTENLNLS